MPQSLMDQVLKLESQLDALSCRARRLRYLIDQTPGFVSWKDHCSVYQGQNIHSAIGFVDHGNLDMKDPNFIAGKPPESLYTDATAELLYAEDQRVITRNCHHTVLRMSQFKNQQAHPLLINKAPIHDENGDPIGVVSSSIELYTQPDFSTICHLYPAIALPTLSETESRDSITNFSW